LANTCSVGQMPGQPIGFADGLPAPVGFTLPLGLPVGHVPAANANRPSVWLPTANRCTRSTSWGLPPTSGPNASDVPAPLSNASMFIGCFEYSYDSTPVEKPARSIHDALSVGSKYRSLGRRSRL